MPHNNSAKKRARQNETRRQRNKSRLTELKTIRKQVLRALHDGKPDEAKTLYREMSSRLDQAASLKTIHHNNAARAKARMALKIQAAASKPAATPAK
jgi:small subunit ribosomal protein S20